MEGWQMSTGNKKRKVHLEIQQHRKNPIGLFRTTYYHEGKIKHETLGRVTGIGIQELRLVQAALQDRAVLKSEFEVVGSKEYGATKALLELAKQTGLDRMIYSRPGEQWVRDALAIIVGRAAYAGSKLALTRMAADSTLWEQAGIEGSEIDVNKHCYEVMDRLLFRQKAIQKALAKKHLLGKFIVLYDITSSYLEGEYPNSGLVDYGYNRDKKKGKKQVVIGLICARDGCPIAVEVFRGNTGDAETLEDKIRTVKEDYGVEDAVFVGDRGMLKQCKLDEITANDSLSVRTITALTRAGIANLCSKPGVQLSMFDKSQVVEVVLPDTPGLRYGLCSNPLQAERSRKTRNELISKTQVLLEDVAVPKRKTTDGKLGIRVGKILNKYKAGKYFNTEIKDGRLIFSVNQTAVDEDEAYDGLYVIRTDVKPEHMTILEAVEHYRGLAQVELAFRNLKSPQLEIRPIYHKTDERIHCHVFICMLSYYLIWHMKQRLQPLFSLDSVGRSKKNTLLSVIERLKSIRKEKICFQGVTTFAITKPDEEQKGILELLGVSLS
jgi:transposase